jgi:lambda family phage minor tail protein L
MSFKSTDHLNKEIFSLSPDVLVNLYEIDFSNLQHNFEILQDQFGITVGEDLTYRFCGAINGSNPIIWQGFSYQPLPINSEGFEHKADGRMARPKLLVANPDGLFSRILKANQDFVGCKITRKRTYVKFLDAENFQNRNSFEGINPFGESDPDAHFPDDVYFINKKITENRTSLEFELVSVLEIENAYIPGRVIHSNFCSWSYRCSIGCGYKGKPIESAKGGSFIDKMYEINSSISGEIINNLNKKVDDIESWSHNKGNYRVGDVVKIINENEKNPYKRVPFVFVCTKDHVSGSRYYPFFRQDYWLKDECSKTINACKKRFGKHQYDFAKYVDINGDVLSEYKNNNPDGLTKIQFGEKYWDTYGRAEYKNPDSNSSHRPPPEIGITDEGHLPFGGFPGTHKYGYV